MAKLLPETIENTKTLATQRAVGNLPVALQDTKVVVMNSSDVPHIRNTPDGLTVKPFARRGASDGQEAR